MRSERPKPLHLLCGRPMVLYVLDALAECGLERAIIVVGHSAERVTKKLSEHEGTFPLDFIEQVTQLGTGDAVSVALTAYVDDSDADDTDDVLVFPGDTPLLTAATVDKLVEHHRATGAACTLLSAVLDDPTGYGRVIRGKADRVVSIVEEADATEAERAINEINTAMYCFRRSLLAPALRRVRPDNAQGELYLTDVVGVLRDVGYPVEAIVVDDAEEARGVNDRRQLATAEAALRTRTNRKWMNAGVTMVDPTTTYLDVTVQLAPDVTLFPGTILQGETVIGEGAEIGPNTRIVDGIVGAGAIVSNTTAIDAEIGADARVGPYAVIDPGVIVARGERVAAFTHLQSN